MESRLYSKISNDVSQARKHLIKECNYKLDAIRAMEEGIYNKAILVSKGLASDNTESMIAGMMEATTSFLEWQKKYY
jgi:hypothetical protein